MPNILSKHNKEDLTEIMSYLASLNWTTNSDFKVWNKQRIITLSDILWLDQKVINKMNLHDIHSSSLLIVVSMEWWHYNKFIDIQTFSRDIVNNSKKIEKIVIEWKIFLVVDWYEVPMPHKIKLRIWTSMKPSEVFKLMVSWLDNHQIDFNRAPLVCEVDYVHPIFWDELLSHIDQWYKWLPEIHANNYISNILYKYSWKIASLFELVFKVIIITSAFVFINYRQNSSVTINLYVFLIALVISGYLGSMLGKIVYKNLDKIEKNSPFELTKWDINNKGKLKKANNKAIRRFLWDLFSSIWVSLLLTYFWL
jgi:hypothetical protein